MNRFPDQLHLNDRISGLSSPTEPVPLLLSSDSHGPEHIGDFTYAADFVHQAMFPESLILNNQIPRLKVFLQTRQEV